MGRACLYFKRVSIIIASERSPHCREHAPCENKAIGLKRHADAAERSQCTRWLSWSGNERDQACLLTSSRRSLIENNFEASPSHTASRHSRAEAEGLSSVLRSVPWESPSERISPSPRCHAQQIAARWPQRTPDESSSYYKDLPSRAACPTPPRLAVRRLCDSLWVGHVCTSSGFKHKRK